jgi:ferredoxin-like protein FixX
LFSFKPSQAFEKIKKTKVQVQNPALTSSFLIFSDIESQSLNPSGIFPRRVEIGEVLYTDFNYKILSPINGIAYLDANQKKISLQIDGELNFKPKYERKEFSLLELKNKLNQLGIVTLDFKNQPFSDLLDEFRGSKETHIVLAPIVIEGNYDYKQLLTSKFKPELESFKRNLEKTFPNTKILDFLNDKKIDYRYPEGFYKLFLKKYCDIPISSTYDHTKILYIGPETLYHIIQGIYYNIPFHERIVGIGLLNKNGKLEGETRFFKIKNGTNLTEFFKNFNLNNNYKYVTVNSLYKKEEVIEIGNEFIFNIYKYKYLYICENKSLNSSETICIECGDCNYFCPVEAKPKALLDKDTSEFLTKECLECGLCSVFCPAHIDFQTRIIKNKGKSNANS